VSAPPGELLSPYVDFLGRDMAAVLDELEHFEDLLHKWQKVQNLVSRETLGAFWSRHVADSLQLLPHIAAGASHILDLGSGGGFPALPLAIALKPGPVSFRLVDSVGRKGSFLRTVARELDLSVKVDVTRIESLDSRETASTDLVTSRAFAPLDRLLPHAARLAPDARLLLHKGREYGAELAKARAEWDFDVVVIDSKTDPDGVLLDIGRLRRRDDERQQVPG